MITPLSRRQFLAASAAGVALGALAQPRSPAADAPPSYGPFHIGAQSYSFRDFPLERALKRQKMTPCLCPRCAASRGRRPHAGFQPLAQLELPCLVDVEPWPEGFDFPTPTLTRPSWAEWANDRQQRALRICVQTPPDDWDDGLL